MSDNLHDPNISEKQTVNPATAQADSGPEITLSRRGTASSSWVTAPTVFPLPVSHTPRHPGATMKDDMQRTVNMPMSQVREEASHPISEILLTGAQMNANLLPSSSQGQTYPVSERDSSHSDLVSNYKKSTQNNILYISSSSTSTSCPGGVFNTSIQWHAAMKSIPFFENDQPSPINSFDPPVSKYTLQSAALILKYLGLEKEDLMELVSYPEHQTTPENLPFVLHEIQMRKAKRAKATAQPQLNSSMSGTERLTHSGGAGIHLEKMSSVLPQPNEVTDNGCSGSVGNDIRKASGCGTNSAVVVQLQNNSQTEEPLQSRARRVDIGASSSFHEVSKPTSLVQPQPDLLPSQNTVPSAIPVSGIPSGKNAVVVFDGHKDLSPTQSHNQTEEPLQKRETRMDISASFSPREQGSSVTSLSSLCGVAQSSVAASSSDVTEHVQTKPNLTPQSLITTLPLENKGIVSTPPQPKPEVSRPTSLEQPQPDLLPASNPQPSATPVSGTPAGKNAMVVLDSHTDLNETRGCELTEQMKTQEMEGKPRPQPVSSVIPKVRDSLPPQGQMSIPMSSPVDPLHVTALPSQNQSPPKVANSTDPTKLDRKQVSSVLVKPRMSTNTCSHCHKEFSSMKDLTVHQKISLHLDNSNSVQKGATSTEVKPSPTTPVQTPPKLSNQKTSRKSRSRSHSPHRHRHSEGRRQRRSSTSRSRSKSPYHRRHSPEGRRYKRRSRSPSSSRSFSSYSPWYRRRPSFRQRSHSSSQDRRTQSRRRDERQPTPKMRSERQSPKQKGRDRRSSFSSSDDGRPASRRRERQSPRRDRKPPSSSSSSDEKQLKSKRRRERQSPRRYWEERSSSSSSDEKQPASKRRRERRSPKKKSLEQRSSSSSRDDIQSSPKKGATNMERLTDKLLKAPAVQILSDQSSVEAVVKSLVPALLAEITKMKGSMSPAPSAAAPSPSSKESTTRLSEVKREGQKSDRGFSSKPKAAQPSPPTMLKLAGIHDSLSRSDVIASMEHFGKTKSVLLFRSKQQASVCFEKVEDAQKLRHTKSFEIKGTSVSVVSEEVPETPSTAFGEQNQNASVQLMASTSMPTVSEAETKSSLSPPSPSVEESKTNAKLTVFAKALVSTAPQIKTANTTLKMGSKPSSGRLKTAASSSVPKELLQNKSTSKKSGTQVQKSDTDDTKQNLSSESCETSAEQALLSLEEIGQVLDTQQAKQANTSLKDQSAVVDIDLKEDRIIDPKEFGEVRLAVPEEVERTSSTEHLSDTELLSTSRGLPVSVQAEKSSETEHLTETTVVSTSVDPTVPVEPEKTSETEHLTETTTVSPSMDPTVPVEPEKNSETEHLTETTTVSTSMDLTVPVEPEKTSETEHPTETTSISPSMDPTVPVEAEKSSDTERLTVTMSLSSSTDLKASMELDRTSETENLTGAESSANGSSVSHQSTRTVDTTAPRPLDEAVQQLQNPVEDSSPVECPKSRASGPETADFVHEGRSAEGNIQAKQNVEDLQMGPKKKDPPTEAETQQDRIFSAANSVSTEPIEVTSSSPATSSQPPAATGSSSKVKLWTFGDDINKYLKAEKLASVHPTIKPGNTMILLTNLPKYPKFLYTEKDVADQLTSFGFLYYHHFIYIVPQANMAFALMPDTYSVQNVMDASSNEGIFVSEHRLCVCAIDLKVIRDLTMLPFQFYKFLLTKIGFNPQLVELRTIYIENISPGDSRDLGELVRADDRVINFLPLLNKVFIEFDTEADADWLMVWYSLQKEAPEYRIRRLSGMDFSAVVPRPRLPPSIVPDARRMKSGTVMPPRTPAVCPKSASPFFVTLSINPYVFRTVSPWFHIPDHVTIRDLDDLKKLQRPAAPLSTVMLTNLPAAGYQHEDIAGLAWPYLDKQNRRALFYRVTVLPLQRRAFVHFSSWDSCRNFLKAHVSNPLAVNDWVLSVHLVSEDMRPGFTEATMYRSLMKWSNAHALEESLEERLLCVEMPVRNPRYFTSILRAVTSIAPIVGFLPLANRLCIEMSESSGVAKVLEKTRSGTDGEVSHPKPNPVRHHIQHAQSASSLAESLKASEEIPIDLCTKPRWERPAPTPRTLSPSPEPPAPTETLDPPTAQTSTASLSQPGRPATFWTGEAVAKSLQSTKVVCLRNKTVLSAKFASLDKKVLLMTNLPEFCSCRYTERELAQRLARFGFQCQDKHSLNIYVLPLAHMAFFSMPTAKSVQDVLRASLEGNLSFRGNVCKLRVTAIPPNKMSPFCFYEQLMKWMDGRFPEQNATNSENMVYVEDVSPSEARTLGQVLRRMDGVRNFLPLLNKVFIEFETHVDVDQIGVWFSLLKSGQSYRIYRLRSPSAQSAAPSPKLTPNGVPDVKDRIRGAEIPPKASVIPRGVTSPFWVTMSTYPFTFQTSCPWFNVPDHVTIEKMSDLEEVTRLDSAVPTLMFTGLPKSFYQQEEVAKLVWPYFPEPNLQWLYYNLTVLPLQRRAFVHFSSVDSCCDFLRDHVRRPIFIRGSQLGVHLVSEDLRPGFTEEAMYRSVSRWSNTHVPELESLEQRLLCVQVSDTNPGGVALVASVMSKVASVAPFVSFLPLANRICVEMSESEGVAKILRETCCEGSRVWTNGELVETVENLKLRLQNSRENTIRYDSCHQGAQPARRTQFPSSLQPQDPVLAVEFRTSLDSTRTIETVDDFLTATEIACPLSPPTASANDPEVHDGFLESDQVRSAAETSCSAAAESGHKVSAERKSTQSVESDSQGGKSETPHRVDDQQSEPADLREDAVEEIKEDEEEEDEQILDSVDEKEQVDEDGNPEGSSEIQSREPELEQSEDSGDENRALVSGGEERKRVENVSEQRFENVSEQWANHEHRSGDTLVSVDGRTRTEEPEMSDNQIGEADIKPVKEEEAFQEISPVDPLSSNTEPGTKRRRTRSEDVAVKEEDVAPRRSGRRARASEDEEPESPAIKSNKVVKKYETRKKTRTSRNDPNVTEETLGDVLDSVEDKSAEDASGGEASCRRRTTGGSNRTIVTRSSSRGQRPEPPKTPESSNETTGKDETPTRRRKMPVRGLRERTSPKESQEDLRDVGKKEGSEEVLDPVEDDRSIKGRKAKRGRPNKNVKAAQRQVLVLKKEEEENKSQEEEETDQVVSSTDEETRTDKSLSESRADDDGGTNIEDGDEEKEDQIADSAEDSPVQEELRNSEGRGKKEGSVTQDPRSDEAGLKEDSKSESEKNQENQENQETAPATSALVNLDETGGGAGQGDKENQDLLHKPSERKHHVQSVKADQRRNLDEPEAKRPRVSSPCHDKLPPFDKTRPLGQEFVIPASGFFCSLCSMFYLNERVAKNVHCSSRRHYDNLQKHYQKLREESGGRSLPD